MSTKKVKLLESAQKNIQKGQYARAIAEYEEVISLDPGDIRHRQKLAELLAKINRNEEAVKEYTTLAKHYIDAVHYLKAIAVYKQIQKLDPENPEVSLTLASLNEKQGLIGNAIAEYNAALQFYERNKENRKALKVLESLLTLDPMNSAIRLRIAEKLFAMGEEVKALEGFTALALDLRDKDDTNGFNHVANRLTALFPEQAQKILAIPSPPAAEEEPVSPPVIAPVPEPSPGSLVTVAEQEALPPEMPAIPSPAVPLEREETGEIIEEPLEVVEEHPTTENEWEEEIDLGGVEEPTEAEVRTGAGEMLGAEPVELTELELEALPELELEILPEFELELEVLPELELEAEPEIVGEEFPVEATEGLIVQEPAQLADTFDLAGELALFADELDFELPRRDTGEEPFAAEAEMFKTSDLDREDAESHYSLGLAYKEMGLYEEAVNEFIVASNSPARKIDCLLLQSQCHREHGDITRSVAILTILMEEPSVSDDELLTIKYELALCHELLGETEDARRLFTEIVTVRPRFSDATSRLKNL